MPRLGNVGNAVALPDRTLRALSCGREPQRRLDCHTARHIYAPDLGRVMVISRPVRANPSICTQIAEGHSVLNAGLEVAVSRLREYRAAGYFTRDELRAHYDSAHLPAANDLLRASSLPPLSR